MTFVPLLLIMTCNLGFTFIAFLAYKERVCQANVSHKHIAYKREITYVRFEIEVKRLQKVQTRAPPEKVYLFCVSHRKSDFTGIRYVLERQKITFWTPLGLTGPDGSSSLDPPVFAEAR